MATLHIWELYNDIGDLKTSYLLNISYSQRILGLHTSAIIEVSYQTKPFEVWHILLISENVYNITYIFNQVNELLEMKYKLYGNPLDSQLKEKYKKLIGSYNKFDITNYDDNEDILRSITGIVNGILSENFKLRVGPITIKINKKDLYYIIQKRITSLKESNIRWKGWDD